MAKDVSTEDYVRAQNAAYTTEHMGAWLFAAIALVLGVLGMLAAFDIIDFRDYGPTAADANATLGSIASDRFWDGLLFLTVGLAAAFLALCLHLNDHHRSRDVRAAPDNESSMWGLEHAGAYIMAVVTVALGTIALLSGFDAFDTGSDQRDGFIWAVGAVGSGILTTTLHAVRHHQLAAEEDYLVHLVERRVSTTGRTTGTVRETGTERIP